MRLSSSMLYQNSMQNIVGKQAEFQKVGMQLSSGKRVITPSDDPLAAAQALVMKQADARNTQLQDARQSAELALNAEETALQDVVGVIQEVQKLIVQAGNESMSDTDREALAKTLEGYKDQLVNLANSKDGNGRYIFGGFKTDKPPFEVDANGQVNYVGGETPRSIAIDEYREIQVSHTGTDAFLTGANVKEPDGSPAESNIFKNLDNAINALRTPIEEADDATIQQVRENLEKASRGMNNSLDNVSSVRAEIGSSLTEVTALKNNGSEKSVMYAQRIEELEGADWYGTISDYVMIQVTLQAAQQTFMDMQNISLFNMK